MTIEKVKDAMVGIELGVDDLCGILEGHTHLTPQGREKILNMEVEHEGKTLKVGVYEVDAKLPTIDLPRHSRGIGCPHCGEEFGIEGEAEAERAEMQQEMLKANWHKIVEDK